MALELKEITNYGVIRIQIQSLAFVRKKKRGHVLPVRFKPVTFGPIVRRLYVLHHKCLPRMEWIVIADFFFNIKKTVEKACRIANLFTKQ